jgi:hypothetical protein
MAAWDGSAAPATTASPTDVRRVPYGPSPRALPTFNV